jgi:ketosteroid isomerase-like protein
MSALEVIWEYYKAFTTLEMNAIVPYFCEPCMSVGPQGVFSAENHAVLANAFASTIDSLRAKGYGRSEFVEPQVTMLGETAALVRGVAVRYSAAGPEMERLQIGYLMHHGEAGWKIAAMVFME